MSPFPRTRNNDAAAGGDRRLQTRLDLLILLMVLQLALSVFILCSRPRSAEQPLETAKLEQPTSEEAAPTAATAEEPAVVTTFEPPAPAAEQTIDWSQINIDVLNGCGVPGLAKKIQKWLEVRGYHVRDTDNADRHDYPRSFIQLREGSRATAEALANSVGINPTRIVDVRSPNKKEAVHLSLIIGLDYKELAFARK